MYNVDLTCTLPLVLHYADDGTYAMKKVLIQNSEQLEMVREEIRVSSQFNHPNLLPLLDHAIIAVKVIVVLADFFSLYHFLPVSMY